MQSASASARTALKQSSTEGEAAWDPEAESVPKEGLELWLDASVNVELEDSEEARASADSRGVYSFFAYSGPATSPVGEAVYRWSCRGGTGTVLTADWYAGRGRGSVPSHDVGSPVWRAGNCVADSGPTPSVFFDYGHTATFNRSFGAKTVVSVHSFEQRGRADHMRVHGYAGELCNFYIFTDEHNYPMHTGSAQDPHNLGALGEGSLRLDGCHALPFSQSSCWFDQGPRLAVAQFATEKRPLSRIGADRNCHHFCGSIAEVLVYSRDLKLHEIEALERYLKAKHRSSTIPLLQRLAFSVVLQNPPDADILSTVPEHIRNQIPTAS